MFSESGELSRFEEMHGINNHWGDIPVDPTTVGNTQNNPIDNENKDEKNPKNNKEKIPTIPDLTIAETQKWIDAWKKWLWKFLQMHPDALAINDKWPEAIKQAWLDVREKGWPC